MVALFVLKTKRSRWKHARNDWKHLKGDLVVLKYFLKYCGNEIKHILNVIFFYSTHIWKYWLEGASDLYIKYLMSQYTTIIKHETELKRNIILKYFV